MTIEHFVGLIADAGRGTLVFPTEPFCGWCGQAHEVHGREGDRANEAGLGFGIYIVVALTRYTPRVRTERDGVPS